MRAENQELSNMMARLQEENKRLSMTLRHSDSFHSSLGRSFLSITFYLYSFSNSVSSCSKGSCTDALLIQLSSRIFVLQRFHCVQHDGG